MSETGSGGEDPREFKRRLVKAARMYAMSQKAEIQAPLDVVGIAVAAFEDMTLNESMTFVRSNEQTLENLAWAFKNSNSTEEFEQKVREVQGLS